MKLASKWCSWRLCVAIPGGGGRGSGGGRQPRVTIITILTSIHHASAHRASRRHTPRCQAYRAAVTNRWILLNIGVAVEPGAGAGQAVGRYNVPPAGAGVRMSGIHSLVEIDLVSAELTPNCLYCAEIHCLRMDSHSTFSAVLRLPGGNSAAPVLETPPQHQGCGIAATSLQVNTLQLEARP